MKKKYYIFAFCIFCLSLFPMRVQAQWTQINIPDDVYTNCLAIRDTVIYAGTEGSGVYFSNDNGDSWNEINTGLTDTYIWTFAIGDTNLFTGTMSGVFRLSNNGTSWTDVNSELTSTIVRALAIRDTHLFAGTYDRGVFVSTNNGDTWTEARTGMFNGYVRAIAIIDTHLFAGTWGGVFLSTNNASTWTEVSEGLTHLDIRTLTVSDTNIFAGTWGGGVFISNNYGTSWTGDNSGLTNNYVGSLVVIGTNIFAGTLENMLWRRPFFELITSLLGLPGGSLPTRFSLEQNYPNPFNPSTKIELSLPKTEIVTLKVYTILGEEVVTLVSGKLQAGKYHYEFNGRNLASGVYLYRIKAGSFQEVKKMVLIK